MSLPPFLPWLSHLRTDRRGLPVPYVNAWGAEADAQATVQHDPWVKREAAFMSDTGDTPDFTRQNMQRQRECVFRRLCQVCAKPIPWSRRRLVVSSLSVEYIDLNGRNLPVVTEPWLDDRCAYIAMNWCPALIRRKTTEDLVLVEVTSSHDVSLVCSQGWLEGPLEAQTKASPVVMWGKIALRTAQIVRADASPPSLATSHETL